MKLYKVLEDVDLDEQLKNEKHDIIEKAIQIYSRMKHTSKTHRSVAYKHLADVREIKRSISLDCTRNDVGDAFDERILEMKDCSQKKEGICQTGNCIPVDKKIEQFA